MEKQLIISIGREYGSAGHEIAEKVAKDLNLPLYDRHLLDKLAEEKGMNLKDIEKYDEKPRNLFLSRNVNGFSNSFADTVAEMQFNFIREKAESGESFVVVGRCSEVVLAGNEALVSVFILGNKQTKVEHVKKKYNLSENEALQKMARHDRKRKAYHNAHSKISWGDSRGYDLCINSSRLGVEKTAKLIEQYAKAKTN